jgi:phage FluMu gp28-like protein
MKPEQIHSSPNQSEVIRILKTFFSEHHFLPTQLAWITDLHPLRIIQKSRQVGITYADAFDSVLKASFDGARFDVWVSSRDEAQAKLYLEDCKFWAKLLHRYATDLGQVVLDRKTNSSAYVLQFASGRRIYCLSSNPNAFAGKRGHVKIDEFAIHQDQRLLYRVAKPVTTWGGQLSIISTHRGANTVFNQIIREIQENGNPMGWSLHTITIQQAVVEGIVERINKTSGRHESPEQFLARQRAECIDEEQWLQEYCCVPADENTAFISHDMITACEDPECLKNLAYLLAAENPLYIGVDVARKQHLCVIDVGEKIGQVVHDRLRIEFLDRPFSAIKAELFRLLTLPKVQRACIDATGLGIQLAEEARETFGWKVEPVIFTHQVKERLAFNLRTDFENAALRVPRDPNLRADLRGIKKEVTPSGNIRFVGEAADSHCDRFWAKALRQEASRSRAEEPWALLC